MKSVIFFANVGTRDLQDNNSQKDKIENMFEWSKKIWEEKKFDGLSVPILLSALEYLRGNNYDIKMVILFGTEQLKIHNQDTFYIALILQELLSRSISKEKIKIAKIPKNPADRDEMYKFYDDYFMGLKENYEEDYDLVFLSLTSGTPAQNEGMLISAISTFGIKTHALYQSKGHQVTQIDAPTTLYKKIIKKQVDILKENKLYNSALFLVEKYDIKDENVDLLKARSYRNVFNFTDAITHYKKAMEKVGGEEFNKIKSELEEIEKLEKFDTTTQHSIKENLDYYILLLEELCRNIENKYEQGEYVDFIARLFRFNEAFLRCIIEMETNIQTNNEEELKKYINEENLSKYFEERKIEIRRSTIVYKKIIEHLLKKKEKKDFLGKANDFIKKIDSINDIRNNSIAAHGFRGVAKKDLVEKGTPEPAEIKKLLELLKEEYLKKEHC